MPIANPRKRQLKEFPRKEEGKTHTHRGPKTDGAPKSQVLGLSKLAILVHQQFWYPFGWFRERKKQCCIAI